MSVWVFLPGVCQSRHIGWSEAAEWYAARLQITDSEISAWPECGRWSTPNCLHADGGSTALYLHRTVVQHASLLSDGPAVPLRSVSCLHVWPYVLCHISWLLSILCLLQGEHQKCANKSKSTLLLLGLGCDQSHTTSHLIIYILITYTWLLYFLFLNTNEDINTMK